MRVVDIRLKFAGILVVWLLVAAAVEPLQAAPQRKDEAPKFGNGAMLRRIFGDGEKTKQAVEKAKTAQRDSLEATRQRFKRDSDTLKEKLGFQSKPDEAPSATAASQAGRIADEPPHRFSLPFAPQQPDRLSISDRQDPRATAPILPASVLRSNNNPNALSTRANSNVAGDMDGQNSAVGSGVGMTGPRQPAAPRPIPAASSAFEPAPRNQPRVPSQPTFASPQTLLPTESIGNRAGSILERGLELPTNAPPSFGAFGIIVETSETVPGLVIKSIKPKSVAAHAGLQPGDVIKNVAGLDVKFVEEVDSLVEVLEPEDEFEITFLRKGKSQTKTFSLPQ